MTWTVQYYNFSPTYTYVPSYEWTFDGVQYNAEVKWNIANKGYFVHLYNSSGTLVMCRPLMGSETSYAINSASWLYGTVTLTLTSEHRLAKFQITKLHVSGCTPAEYNGVYDVMVTGRSTLSYPMAVDPGTCTVTGRVGPEINLIEGYFTSNSRLIYRTDSGNFEVWTYSE